MNHKLLNILIGLLISFVFTRCAQIGVLSGGTKDNEPPKLIEAIPIQKALNFSTEEILLRFDEFVQLKDLNNQLMVSPKLPTKPTITVNGKKISIKLNKSELLPNTTYRLYFGKAIADMHEGNVLLNFTYIFSTGSFIDTLKIKGEIYNALHLNKEKDVVVGLYYNKNLSDSFPFKQTPDYISRTNDDGQFEFENLPNTQFKLLCFTDKNKDYKYNGAETEQIGFYEKTIDLTTDSSYNLALFNEIPTKTFIKKVIMTENGYGTILFNQKTITKIRAFIDENNTDVYNSTNQIASDTCIFYYRNFKDSLWLKVNYGNGNDNKTDTLKLRIPVVKAKYKVPVTFSGNIRKGSIPYFEQPILKTNTWIDTTKTKLNKLTLVGKKDTAIKHESLKLTWLSPISFVINNTLKSKDNYQLKIDSGSFYSFNGSVNDSLVIPFEIIDKKDYGKLQLNITFNKKQAYIIQLLNEANKPIKEEYASFSLSASNTASVSFKNIPEGTYKLKIIYDSVEDKTWNTGSFLKTIQPEKTYIFEKTIKIIPNWEVEEEFILKE